MRGVLEPHQPLDRRAQGLEIRGGKFRVGVPIISAKKEQGRYVQAVH